MEYDHNCAVVGCTDELRVVNGWASRLNNNHLVVRCNWTRREFHMKCVGNSWVGDVVNCTQHRRLLFSLHSLAVMFEDSCRCVVIYAARLLANIS